jgi:monooxygenase
MTSQHAANEQGTNEHFDCVIIGAGLSGIGMAYQLMRQCPEKSFVILEGRDAIGGTWDLFRYPGIRSDSSMVTLGYSFRPWTAEKSIASGDTIRSYIRDTARIYGIDRQIRFRQRVTAASFSSSTGHWTLDIESGPDKAPRRLSAGMLLSCAGYYRYDQGYTPAFPGRSSFQGTVIHPQHWPTDFDATNKRVVVIGSGATAVSLIPSLAETAAHVTMLQRSPSYVVPWPDVDPFALAVRRRLPLGTAARIARWKSAVQGLIFFKRCRGQPEKVRALLLDAGRQVSGSPELIAKHFTPRYNPWDQRMCLSPKGDLFTTIKAGKASVVTDEIDCFVAQGIKLKSGETLAADVIVTATGLNLQSMGGMALTVDGQRIDPGKLVGYRGVMYGGVPNLINTMGYVNASWTLKSDLTARFACRLLRHLDRAKVTIARPSPPPADMALKPWSDFSSGYFERSRDVTPKQGTIGPWRAPPNYIRDYMGLRFGRLDDGVLQFQSATGAEQAKMPVKAAA